MRPAAHTRLPSQAVDCTLPPAHPYHQACGLRSGSSTSLVSVEFCSFPPAYQHPAVPEGLQYYTLQAQLSGTLGRWVGKSWGPLRRLVPEELRSS